MSNRYDALRKEGVVGFGDLIAARADQARDQKATAESSRTALHPLSPQARTLDLSASRRGLVFPFDNGQQAAVEQYQIIRTKILHNVRKPQLILVSSASSGDGKTFTSINLAASLGAKAETSVLLLDGDLRQPTVADALGFAGSPGLADVLAGRVELESALVRAAQLPNLFVLSAGMAEGRATELLDSAGWRSLLPVIRARFGYVIIDSPPIGTVADFELLQLVCDGTIVVVRPDHTGRSACAKALENVSHAKLLGVVLNGVEDWWLWKTPAYGYYDKSRSGQQPR